MIAYRTIADMSCFGGLGIVSIDAIDRLADEAAGWHRAGCRRCRIFLPIVMPRSIGFWSRGEG